MQKLTTYIILFLILAGGLLLLYRVLLSSKDLTKIYSKVVAKNIEVTSTHKQRNHYGLIFELDNYHDKLGIYIGPKEQSSDIKILNVIDTNNIYTFLVDPTVSTDNGINLGVREINLNGVIVYKEPKGFNLLGGIFLTVLSLVGLFIITKYKRT